MQPLVIVTAACRANTEKRPRSPSGTFKHRTHNKQTGWQVGPPERQPTIPIRCRLDTQAYEANNQTPPKTKARPTEFTGLADTGAQMCVAGSDLLISLGLTKNDLFKTESRLSGPDNSGIIVQGGIYLNISLDRNNGKVYNTKQVVYISQHVENMFLSKSACIDLGLLSANFPTTEHAPGPQQQEPANHGGTARICCISPAKKRTKPERETIIQQGLDMWQQGLGLWERGCDLLEGVNNITSEDRPDQTHTWTSAREQTRRGRRNTTAQHRDDPRNCSYLSNRDNNGRPKHRDHLNHNRYHGRHGNNGQPRRHDNLGNIRYIGSHHNKPKAFATNSSIGGITNQASLPPLGGIGLALGQRA